MFINESQFVQQTDDKCVKVWREEGTFIQPQKITKHYAFQDGSIVVCIEVSVGYCNDLHIFRQASGTAFWYQEEGADSTGGLHAEAVNPAFILMDDNAYPHRAVIINDYLELLKSFFMKIALKIKKVNLS